MLSPVERKIMQIIAERGGVRNYEDFKLAYLEVLKELGKDYPYLFKYSVFLKILKRIEKKLQKAIEDWTLLLKTSLFDSDGKLKIDVEKALHEIKVVVFIKRTSLKEVVENSGVSIEIKLPKILPISYES